MIFLLLRWLVLSLAVFLAAQLNFIGISYDHWSVVIAAALVLGLVNTFIRPLFMVLAFPFILLTFGIFTLFINALMFYLTGLLVRGFHVESFGSAFLASIIVSVASMVLGPRRGRGRVLHARFRIDL